MGTVLKALVVMLVLAYYAISWILVGRDPKRRAIVTLYDPPRALSPAMLRFAWKHNFDDRCFWSAVLSLVAKGLVTIESNERGTTWRETPAARHKESTRNLPQEERILLDHIPRSNKKKSSISMLDPVTAYTATRMADAVHHDKIARMFDENRSEALVGVLLSLCAVAATASPSTFEDWALLGLSLCAMSPGAYFLWFIVLRLRDLTRLVHTPFRHAVYKRALVLLMLTAPCLASIALACVMIGVTFGPATLAVAALMVVVDVAFVFLLRAPTAQGQELLDEIEGFRTFLKSVERHPLDWPDAPAREIGLYERYLPYAIALEVEQAWNDQFIAVHSLGADHSLLPGSTVLYLGMSNGNPIEFVYYPRGTRRGGA